MVRRTVYRDAETFQYPRSDRAHCNREILSESELPDGTFSILGRIEPTATNEEAVVLPADGMVTFSILGRIEPTATFMPGYEGDPHPYFQYPRSDRAHCNLPEGEVPWPDLVDFQYPRSDRAHCNPAARRDPRRSTPPFSILGRIEPTATS